MTGFIDKLESEFAKWADAENAVHQKAYMRNQFEFFGLTSPVRKEIQKPFLKKENRPAKAQLAQTVKQLWAKPQREFQYFAMMLAEKYAKSYCKEDILLFEWMITHKSWWDTVDFIAPHLAGKFFTLFPEKRNSVVDEWLNSGNIWLQRSSLLFQLNYKNHLDIEFLVYVINRLNGSTEFFINKAIGWILRQYSKTNPQWVAGFVDSTPLPTLSKREALKVIERNR